MIGNFFIEKIGTTEAKKENLEIRLAQNYLLFWMF